MRNSLRVANPAAPTASSQPVVQNARLLRLMTDASRHVPMYRDLWAASGADVDELRSSRDFQRLPWLDKAAVRSCRREDRIHDERRGIRLAEELSSGSSGQPITVFKDRAAQLRRRWAFLRAMLACGYRPGHRCLLLTSRRSANWPTLARWSYASIGEDTSTLASRIDALRPDLLYGPLSTLELLAVRLSRQTPRPVAPRLVVSTAEQLTRRRRATLERGFGAPVADFYGMSELGLVAYRPPGHPRFTPARSSLLLEFFPVANEPSIERLIVTDMAERTSPWIRYDTGDLVKRDPGITGRPIVEFAGRSLDCIVLPAGGLVSPYRLDVVLENVHGLRAYEVLQQADLSLDVTLDMTPGTAEQACSTARRGLEPVLGAGLPMRISTGTIRRSPAGTKFRPIRSLARSLA
jgi:phenylacetate-CoA ligase